MRSKLKNILKNIYLSHFKSRIIKIKKKLNRKDYSHISNLLLVDKKTAELFNEELYLKLNPDVKKAGIDAKEHFLKYGINEGRPWQDYPESKNLSVGEIIPFKFDNRDQFLSILENYNSMLEIGCFDKPSLEKFRKNKNVIISYADWLSKEQLQERASKIKGRNKNDVPEIKYVLAEGY